MSDAWELLLGYAVAVKSERLCPFTLLGQTEVGIIFIKN